MNGSADCTRCAQHSSIALSISLPRYVDIETSINATVCTFDLNKYTKKTTPTETTGDEEQFERQIHSRVPDSERAAIQRSP